MSNYFKILIVTLVVLVSSIIVATQESDSSLKNDELATELESDLNKNPELLKILEFPEEQTQLVSHKLDSLFTRINKRHDFHGSILVAQHGKILFSNQYGFSNFKRKTKIDEQAVFQLASVSKQFTATAIMMLKERSVLSLNDSITQYFPNFPYKGVTIKQLLNHTGGLPNYFWIAEHKWADEKAPTNMQMMQLLGDCNINRFFSPGRKFDYSNTGYFVLASIIEKVSNQSYGNFLESNIFEPLQMHNSFAYSFENDPIRANQLDGYRLYRGWRHLKIKGTVNDAIVGDKNVYATSKDLFKWITGLNSGKLISFESLNMMYSNGKTKYGRNVPYGFGFRLDSRENEKVIYHYGRWNGFSTAITQYTDSDLIIIALEHSSYKSMTYLNKTVKKIVLEYFDPEGSELLFTDELNTNNSLY